MRKRVTMYKRWPLVAVCCAVLGVCVPHAAQADQAGARHDGEPAWVLSASTGVAMGRAGVPLTIALGGLVPIRLQGMVMTESGQVQALSLARQFEGSQSDDGEYRRVWRLELEGWKADIRRTGFTAGVASSPLNDAFEARGLFINGLVRVARTERSRWWVGAGVGRVQLSVPDASTTLPGCGCLQAGDTDGRTMRLKARIEWPIGPVNEVNRSAVFVEGAYSRMPAFSTGSASGASTTYEAWGLRTLNLGLKTQF